MWDITGFNDNKKLFEHLLSDHALVHAYIFSGPAMIGKKKFAFSLMAVANNRPAVSDPDVCFIAPKRAEGEAKIYIEDIRDLKSFLSRRPLRGPYKFVCIDDAHTITEEAANAFLKILEEPTADTIFILITDQAKMLPATILSRCQEISFPMPTETEAAEYVASLKESNEDKKLAIALAGGRIGWLHDVFESKRLPEIKETLAQFRVLSSQPVFKRFAYAQKVHEAGNYSELIDLWMRWVRTHQSDYSHPGQTMIGLLELYHLVQEPQYNHRLALEHFFLNL